MLIQQINREDPERIFLTFQNRDGGGSITTGMAVCLVASGDSATVNMAVRATKALSRTFIGISRQDVAINAFGLVTAWGYALSILISQSVGSWTITAGDSLQIGGAGAMTSIGTGDELLSTMAWKYAIMGDTVADTVSGPLIYADGIVRAI